MAQARRHRRSLRRPFSRTKRSCIRFRVGTSRCSKSSCGATTNASIELRVQFCQDDAEAEDAVQQAYLNAYRHLHQFEGRAQFSTWLTRIAVYQALARRRRVGGNRTSSEHGLAETAASPSPDPERQAYGKELSVLLESAVAGLPDGHRSVFMLREVDGLSTAETARHLRISEATVKTRLHRAKGLLQRKLHAVTPAEAFSFDGARCDRLVVGVMRRLADTRLLPRLS